MPTIYSTSPQPVLESAIDWITCTVRAGERASVIAGRVDAWQKKRIEEGETVRGFQNRFYTGLSCGGVSFGKRDTDSMLTLSGRSARRWGATAITWADNVSRLDVQITLRDDDISHNWARYVDEMASTLAEVKAGALTTRLYSKRPKGITAYIGDGGSDRMLRVYDKEAESEGEYPLGSWRWEVQYRKARARSVAQKLLSGSVLPQECLGAVCAAFASYRIDVPTVCLPIDWKDAGIAHTSDDVRRLEWLRRCVAPMVERLRDYHSTDTVLDALGLDDVIDTLEGQKSALEEAQHLYDNIVWKGESMNQTDIEVH
jgi:DNA relaxase NicK